MNRTVPETRVLKALNDELTRGGMLVGPQKVYLHCSDVRYLLNMIDFLRDNSQKENYPRETLD